MIFGICLAVSMIVSLELSARYFSPNWKEYSGNNDLIFLHEYSEIYGWKLRNNARATINGKSVSTNRSGYRGGEDKDISYKKRIVVLGDSISFGYGVGDDETFAYFLERRDRNLDVVNLSVQGYGTDQELLVLTNFGLSFHPDIVILTFCLENDYIDNMNSKFIYDQVHVKPYFTSVNGSLVLHDAHLRIGHFKKFMLWLNDESALFNWALNATTPDPRAFRQNIVGNDQLLRNKVTPEITLSILNKMKDVVLNNNSAFVVLIIPSASMPQKNILAETLINSKELEQTLIIDIGEYFANVRSKQDMYLRDGIHLSPEGHRVVSDAVYDELFPATQTYH